MIVVASDKDNAAQSGKARQRACGRNHISCPASCGNADQGVQGLDLGELKIGQAVAVVAKPHGAVMIFKDELALGAVAGDHVEIMNSDGFARFELDDEILPFPCI